MGSKRLKMLVLRPVVIVILCKRFIFLLSVLSHAWHLVGVEVTFNRLENVSIKEYT